MSGWFDILDGRPTALQVEFPLSDLHLPMGQLPGGSSNTLTARVVVSLSQAGVKQLGEGSGLSIGSTGQEGVQATLWFMAKTRQESTEMALS